MYSYTVRQGGKIGGGGRWRHWQPVRTRENRPSSSRRMSVVRGRPPGLAGGISGASRAYCSSLSACPAPKSPTKARFSAVHMACLQEGLLPSLNRRHGHSASSSVSTARASQTASKTRHGGMANVGPAALSQNLVVPIHHGSRADERRRRGAQRIADQGLIRFGRSR